MKSLVDFYPFGVDVLKDSVWPNDFEAERTFERLDDEVWGRGLLQVKGNAVAFVVMIFFNDSRLGLPVGGRQAGMSALLTADFETDKEQTSKNQLYFLHAAMIQARDLLTGRVSSTGVKWASILQFYWLFFCPSCLVVKPVWEGKVSQLLFTPV